MTTAHLRRLAGAALLLAALPLFAACDTADDGDGDETTVTVMTRNLYLGGDLFALLDEDCEDQIFVCVDDLYRNSVVTSDIPGRMAAIADEIQAADADLVGLQEVSLYRRDNVSDYVQGVTEPNATMVTFDFLQLLMEALEERGLDYEVAATNDNADVEFPASVDGKTFYDIRLTDRDVILARSGLDTSVLREYNFDPAITATIPVGGVDVAFTRGFNSIRVTQDGVDFTFANAHLEVGGAAAQAQRAQATYLASNSGLGTTEPLILVGDFNADPEQDPAGEVDGYDVLVAAFEDAWDDLGEGDDGYTCCQGADLRNNASLLDARIDLVLYQGNVTPISIDVIGEEPGDRTPTGLWPSDPAGVVATLRVRG